MDEETGKEPMDLEEFRSIFVGEEEYTWELEQSGKKVVVVFRALRQEEMAKFNKLLERKGITIDNINSYSDELRLLKLTHAIKAMEVDGTPIQNIEDKEKFGAWLRVLPDFMIRALGLQYDTFTSKIFTQLEDINKEEEDNKEKKS